MKRIILAVLVGVLVSGPAWAEPRRLNEAEIIAFTQGGPFLGTTRDSGYDFNMDLHKNGTIDGTSGIAMDSGIWKIVNDTVCIKWDEWRYGEEFCFYLELNGDGDFEAYFPDGNPLAIFTGHVDLPKPAATVSPIPTQTVTTPTVKIPQPQGSGSVEERLSKLKNLLDKGLLTPDEAAEKRKEILKGL